MTEENYKPSIPENIPEISPASIRDDLVATAVKFLQNPKVQSSPQQQKKDFMKKKGLTDEEIEKAIKLSGVIETAITPVVNHHIASNQPVQAAPHVSGWSRFRDYSSLVILVAGVVYGLYSLYKKFIEPMFLRRYKEQDEKLNRMEKGIADLNSDVNKNLQDLQSSVHTLRDQLTDQSMKLATVSSNLSDYKDSATVGGSSKAINAIQSELASLKALLLGRKQFPSTPSVPPVIPSWQMKPKTAPVFADQMISGGDGPSLDESVDRSLEVPKDQSSQETNSTTAVVKTISKSDLEQESEDETPNSNDSMQELTGGDNLSSPSITKYVDMNGHTGEDGKSLTENSSLLGSDTRINGSPVHNVFSHPIPDKAKVVAESELD